MRLNIDKVYKPIVRGANKVLLKAKKYSPEILLAGAIVCAGVAIISAIKETKEADEILKQREKDLIEAENLLEHEHITEKEYKSEMFRIFKTTATGLLKAYIPTLILFAASTTCMIGSYSIVKARYAAASAALAALEKSYNDYRRRVVKELGEEKEYELYSDKKELIDEDGNVSISYDETEFSILFDSSNPMYRKNGKLNWIFLRQCEEEINRLFQLRGHMFFNDMRGVFYTPKVKTGQIYGKIYDPENPEWIDFGLDPNTNPEVRDFIDGVIDRLWIRVKGLDDIYNLMVEER